MLESKNGLATALGQIQRAELLLQAGRGSEAWLSVAPLRQAIDRHGKALRSYARMAMAVGQIDAAVAALLQAAKLENDPPDLIGGIADLLDTVGRYDESLRYWDMLVGLRPDLADAHLNRAVTAAKADQHDRAVRAADEGLKRFPGHARLLAVKAMALKNAGRVEESVKLFEIAVAADPNRALTRHNQAVALRAAQRFDEACDAFQAASRLGLAGASFHANWAAAALEGGKVADAVELYQRALREDPAHKQALKGLTRIKIEYLQEADGFDHFEQSVADRGGSVEAWIDWISELSANYRYKDAADIGHRGLLQHPDEPALLAMATFAEGMSGDAAAALARLDTLPPRVLQPASTLIARAQIALRAGNPALAAELAEEYTRTEPTSQIGWAILGLAWRLTGDAREQWLCDYERLVMVTEVPSADGALSATDYAAVVAAALDPLHKSQAAPGNQSLREGTQTSGALFDSPDPIIQGFRDAVRLAAERMMPALADDSRHPFLGRKSNQLGFSGSWSVRLRPGSGHHVPHFHSFGWMSSAYYARLPETRDAARAAHQGWIHFGAPPAMFDLDLPPRRIVEPMPGRLVLFPSYLWHGTIPFESGDRLTAAFDYQPL